jgi:phosphatidylinositol alpha-1,6-mannosyltransferase
MPRTLVITNDFPPRQGGIETFVHAMTTRFPPGAATYDAGLPFPVVRDRARTLLPVPRVAERAVSLARDLGCDRVWFGAAAPLGLIAGTLRRRAGVRRVVATTHGHEVWWSRAPGARWALRRIGATVDILSGLGEPTGRPIARALRPRDARRLAWLAPGVDITAFRPGRDQDRARIRERYGLAGRPVVLCSARLVRRKGQDVLIEALPAVRRAVPGATLLLVGAGPEEPRLRRLARSAGVAGAVVFAGGHPHTAMPGFYAAADVFALPCRTRRWGLEVEGRPLVSLEAAAAGLPVVAGDSGGAPDTVRDGETGWIVDGGDPGRVADRLIALLGDPAAAQAMGRRGRAWVAAHSTWDHAFGHLARLLAL